MAAGQHNPSRRALLGAAVALPFVGSEAVLRVANPLHHSPAANGPPPRPGEELSWQRLLADFAAAEAAAKDVELRSALGSTAVQFALEAEYGERLDAMYAALWRLLRAPSPDLAAFATKIVLAIDHEVATLTGGEACLAAIRREARALAAPALPRSPAPL